MLHIFGLAFFILLWVLLAAGFVDTVEPLRRYFVRRAPANTSPANSAFPRNRLLHNI